MVMATAMAVALASCRGKKVYDKYEHTPIVGWEKNDTLSFNVPRVECTGTYLTNLGLRINAVYPFMGLTLIVEQHILPADTIIKDTLKCALTDAKGYYKGSGINYYQYEFRVTKLQLQEGDSLHINVRHNMKREILPGISDVGMSLSLD